MRKKTRPCDPGRMRQASQPPDHPAQPRSLNKHLTIGFLAGNIHLGVAQYLWPGVVDAAQKQNVNLICFPGGELGVCDGFEAQRNVLYDLIDTERLDGLVSWSSTIGGRLEAAELSGFHQRCAPLPMVGLAQPAEGMPTLLIDSYHGMRALVVHLIQVHGHRRLAFIRGPEGHYYAEERFRAYTDVLREHDIAFDPNLVTRPVHWEAGAEAIQMLLDERRLRPGSNFQAVMAVSDLTALSALKALQMRGVRIPGDVAVVGFNDSMEGRLTTPPLTSVALPFYEQGAQAVGALLAQIAGEPVPQQVLLPSSLVVRQSCGCPSEAVVQAAVGPVQMSSASLSVAFAHGARRDNLLAEMTQAAGGSVEAAAWAAQILYAFRTDLGDESSNLFLPALENVFRLVTAADGDVTVWHRVVSILRRYALPHLDPQARSRCEDLCGQARIVIGDVAQRALAYQQLRAERQSETLREIGQALITTFDVDRLANALAELLPRLGIASCYLSLYENPAASLDYARLILAYTEQGRIELEPGGRCFPSRQLAPRELWPARRCSYVVEPLYFHEEHIGFVLFEIGPRDGTVYEALRGHISSALKGALLFREAQAARFAAEKADQIKTRLLSNVSHELRTPLNIILEYTQDALSSSTPYGITPSQSLLSTFQHIQNSAEHQLRVINDLLDLSRAEIDELDLYPELLDPQPLLEEAFHSIADHAAASEVNWQLALPERLPLIQADPVRLQQILLNLLSNARKFTHTGRVALGAQVSPPYLHIWVQDTGLGIPLDQQERIFEPFATFEYDQRPPEGIGLGLSITRRLVALHGGLMTLDSQPGQGSTFHVYLPLPSLSERPASAPETAQPVLLLISTTGQPAAEIVEMSQRLGLAIRHVQAGDDPDLVLANVQPAGLAWDLASAGPGDWAVAHHLRNHPRLCQLPFILYGQERDGAALTVGVTSFIVKPLSGQTLLETIQAACPTEYIGPILIVDDDPEARALHQQLAAQGLPGYSICTANDGAGALAVMAEQTPSLVILDLMMPGLDGFDVLDRMRADPRTRHVPVVILSSKLLNLDDVRRLEQHARVTFQSKGILSDAEAIAALNQALFGADTLPQHTSTLVKRAVAYLHQNYTRPLARWEIAKAIGVSEDYLSRLFHQELGLSPWDYMNRYRIYQARLLLSSTDESIWSIARKVGFKDRAYFSRVFHKLTGVSPKSFREQSET